MNKTSTSILLVLGSRREESYTRALGQSIMQHLEDKGTTVTTWDPLTDVLDAADPAYHRDPFDNPHPKAKELVELSHAANGFVFCSPVYHNSYSGVLKNALDHLAISQFSYKPVGLASHGGNRTTQAVDQLRIVARGLMAIAIPTQVCTQDSDYANSEVDPVLCEPSILQRVDRFTTELVVLCTAMKPLRPQ